jgi:hypothetical protein
MDASHSGTVRKLWGIVILWPEVFPPVIELHLANAHHAQGPDQDALPAPVPPQDIRLVRRKDAPPVEEIDN